MAMTLRLTDDEAAALRRQAELESRSMQEVARDSVREYVERHGRDRLLRQALDNLVTQYQEALDRLAE